MIHLQYFTHSFIHWLIDSLVHWWSGTVVTHKNCCIL